MNDLNEILICEGEDNKSDAASQKEQQKNLEDISDKKTESKNEKDIINTEFENNFTTNNNNEEIKTIIAQTENSKSETIPQYKEEFLPAANARNSNSNKIINSIIGDKDIPSKNKTIDYEVNLNINDTIDQYNSINQTNISNKNINNISKDENQNEEVDKNMKNLSDTKIIENFLNENSSNQKKNVNMQKKIKNVYVTETNVSSLQKNNYNKNTISSIPSNRIKIKQRNKNLTKKIKSTSLDNLSPEIYMLKKFPSNHSNKKFDYMLFKIKRIEEEIKKQNQYDFERAMKDLQMKTDNKIKINQRAKRIEEDHQKLLEKLKNMEEYRQKQLNEKINRVNKKQKINLNANNSLQEISKKLPPINNNADKKAELIRQRQKENEEDFRFNIEQKIKINEIDHKKNYMKQCRILSKKIKDKKKIYTERSDRCILATKDNDSEREESFREKDIMKSYNINQNILRSRSERNVYIKASKRNYENVQENKELLEKKREKQIKAYLKKANKQYSTIQMRIDNPSYNHTKENMLIFSSLQKKNISKAQEEFELKNKELILRQEDLKWYIDEREKDDSQKKKIVMEKKFRNYNKNGRKLKSLDKYIEKMDSENIMNQNDKEKLKKFQEIKRIEYLEKKKKEEEEERKRNG